MPEPTMFRSAAPFGGPLPTRAREQRAKAQGARLPPLRPRSTAGVTAAVPGGASRQGLWAAFMAFMSAIFRPRTALQKAIMGIIAIKIALMLALRMWLALSGAEAPVADAAVAARLIGPPPLAQQGPVSVAADSSARSAIGSAVSPRG